MIADSGSWSLGVLIGLPICGLVLLALLAFAVFALVEREGLIAAGTLVLAALFVGLVLSPLGFYPYSGEYHQYRNVSGTVQRIDSRLIGGGDKSTETKFVVRFDGSGQQYGCDDTRCAGVEKGDNLALSCKREWQYTGTDGYNCRFSSAEAAR